MGKLSKADARRAERLIKTASAYLEALTDPRAHDATSAALTDAEIESSQANLNELIRGAKTALGRD